MSTRAAWRRAHLALSVALLATFARALPYPLQRSWDDGRFILDNPDVRRVSLASLQSIFGAPHFQAYHPLHLLSYWLDVPWSDANPTLLHAVNLALYVIAANLLLRVLAALDCSPAAAAIGCAACVLHPIQVEVVSWATGRKDVLALMFGAGCMLAHLRSKGFGDRAAWSARAFYLLALLSKTTALPLPIVLVCMDVCLRRRSFRQAARDQLPSLVLGACGALYVIALWQREEMVREGGGVFERVAATFGHQLATAVFPSATSPMYSTEPHAGLFDWVSSVALVVALAWGLAQRAHRALFALGAFVLLLLPVSNLVPMYFPVQDRYLSLPLVALAYALAAALDRAAARQRVLALCAGALVVLGLALRTIQYEGVWHDEPRLWGHAVRTQRDAYYAFMKLGEVRRDAQDFYGSIRAYQGAVALDPLRKLGHVALFQAVALRDERLRGLAAQAETHARAYYTALEDPDALRELAMRLLQRGYLRAPELPLERALAQQSFSDAAFERAASTQFAEGRASLALFYLRHMKQPTKNGALLAAADAARRELAHAPVL